MGQSPSNAVDWWEHVVATCAERTFLVDSSNDRSWTFAEFADCVQDLAVQLTNLRVASGDKVVVSLRNGPEFVCLYFACLRIRAIIVPVSPSASLDNAAYIVNTCQPRVIIVDGTTRNGLDEKRANASLLRILPSVRTGENRHEWSMERTFFRRMPAQELTAPSPDDQWIITFTSGSTGQPKAIVHRALSLLTCATAFNRAAGIDANTRLYHVFSMTYMAGFLNTLVCPFVAGATVVLGEEFNARSALSFWQAPMSHGVNTFWVAPTVLRLLLKLDREPRAAPYCKENVRAFHVGTAPLPATVKQDFERRFETQVLESYGLTEVLFVTTNIGTGKRVNGSVGTAIPGVKLRIVDDQGQDVEAGMEGEIRISAPHRMVGYLGVSDPFVDGMFASGDLGTLSPDGMLAITGRKKDLIIRGGFNISPLEIEEVLLQHDFVDCVAVLGTEHEFYGEEVTAVVQIVPGSTLQELQPELVEHCKQRLNSICIPTRFLDLGKLPVTITGKVKKSQVRELIESLPRAA